MHLNGYILASIVVTSFFAGAWVQKIRLASIEKPEPALQLRAIQATCTKTSDCTIILYESVPEVVSVASGKDQTKTPAKVVIVRNSNED